MFGIAKVSSRLISTKPPMPDCHGLCFARSCSTIRAPISPKTAPEAPTVGDSGESTSTPSEPPTSDTP